MSFNMNLNVLSAVEADNIHINRSLSCLVLSCFLLARSTVNSVMVFRKDGCTLMCQNDVNFMKFMFS